MMELFAWIYEPSAWIALGTLTALEIVLGIDNIIFLSILVGRLPTAQRAKARTLGLALAMLLRIAMLISLSWIMGLTAPIATIFDFALSGRDLILLAGGLFLLAKSTLEIHHSLEGEETHETSTAKATFGMVLAQVALLDLVFSLDSVITAVGLADDIVVMVIAVVAAVGVMMVSAGAISRFVDDHPTVKMLALSFLVLVGVTLIADGLHFHIPKGYVYFAMAFSFSVEMLNLRHKKVQAVKLRKRISQ